MAQVLLVLSGLILVRPVLEASADPAFPPREALLAEMGVAMREDGGTLGVFSPKKVGTGWAQSHGAALT